MLHDAQNAFLIGIAIFLTIIFIARSTKRAHTKPAAAPRARNGWPLNVLIALDQLGNALCKGNPDATISARTYYFASMEITRQHWYWLFMQTIINWAFRPIDGKHHCRKAYRSEPDNRHEKGNDKARALLGLLIILFCPLIAIILRIWVRLDPSIAHQTGQ